MEEEPVDCKKLEIHIEFKIGEDLTITSKNANVCSKVYEIQQVIAEIVKRVDLLERRSYG